MANIYGYRYDPHNPDPRALTIPEDCANHGWEPFDPRWNETDLMQLLMYEHDDIDEVHLCFCETLEYIEFKISLEPFEHSIPSGSASRNMSDYIILSQIGVMVSGTLNWQQELLSSKWKTVKANIVEGDDSNAN